MPTSQMTLAKNKVMGYSSEHGGACHIAQMKEKNALLFRLQQICHLVLLPLLPRKYASLPTHMVCLPLGFSVRLMVWTNYAAQ
jgi:hypothetical protein